MHHPCFDKKKNETYNNALAPFFLKNVKVNTVYGKFSEFFSKKYIYKKINYILSIAGIPAINDIPY